MTIDDCVKQFSCKSPSSAVERGCTTHAVEAFCERYPEHCQFRANGKPIGAVPRLQLALHLARDGGKAHTGRVGLRQDARDSFPVNRKVFDVELPADHWNEEPYTIRIVTNSTVTCVITVLPPEFRQDMAAKRKHRGELSMRTL